MTRADRPARRFTRILADAGLRIAAWPEPDSVGGRAALDEALTGSAPSVRTGSPDFRSEAL